ncbi:MAG: FAD-linked oxidase [Leptospiraceae bacterium]|nr:MAG: FAD-linked oxidase [Leptospiraceae bacterium]
MLKKVANWGNFPVVNANIYSFNRLNHLRQTKVPFIVRGLGRSYGDASLSDNIIDGTKNNHFLEFDEQTGLLTCEGGVSLEEILDIFVPRGWFLPVTPGTKFVTVAGAISSDVHGKNHHCEGSFHKHVIWMEVELPTGKIVECSPQKNVDLFRAICGGMGLCGIIKKAKFYLKKIETAYIKQKTYKAKNLDEMLEYFEQSKNATYTVAWMDCLARGKSLGRGILFTGEHATLEDLKSTKFYKNPLSIKKKIKFNVPFYFPSFVLNPLTVKLFNFLVYNSHIGKIKESIVDYDKFFYPLDSIHNWNRIYGKKGFVQYQFVLPEENGYEGTKKIIQEIAKNKMGSFLVVFKLFGNPDKIPQKGSKNGKSVSCPLSFPEEGYTLALDFPVEKKLPEFLEVLDQIVQEYGGRLYLAKDSRMSKEFFYSTYPVEEFLKLKRKFDPENILKSKQSERLGIYA